MCGRSAAMKSGVMDVSGAFMSGVLSGVDYWRVLKSVPVKQSAERLF